MKLLSKPERIVNPVVISPNQVMHAMISNTATEVEIFCPDDEHTTDEKGETWRRLKYGSTKVLTIGEKVPTIALRDENHDFVLHGVLPISALRTTDSAGTTFKCHVDHYEVIPTC